MTNSSQCSMKFLQVKSAPFLSLVPRVSHLPPSTPLAPPASGGWKMREPGNKVAIRVSWHLHNWKRGGQTNGWFNPNPEVIAGHSCKLAPGKCLLSLDYQQLFWKWARVNRKCVSAYAVEIEPKVNFPAKNIGTNRKKENPKGHGRLMQLTRMIGNNICGQKTKFIWS